MKNVWAFIWGGLFSIGLMLSGMSNPAKVIGFLDILGQWDASLAFVMMGAIAIAFIPFQKAVRQPHPQTFYGEAIQLPKNTKIDRKLILGSLLFGIGWGIAGICPAPSFTLIGLGYYQAIYFIIAMSVGVLLHRKVMEKMP
ncbi:MULTISPECIES: YeeE/YedE family protein [Acinetobacter]|uniref:YeeE/YedE family protein n=1 Tax=Acinetobacter TaxID=469 RepID=UPI0007385ADC|nr:MULTISPECIES: YeeE/YedE family protein [Acinetobacter]AXF45595.1 YeeE/YedE family protein [Acinetobacter johnsonii]KUG38849.1 YeeE/YedE family protein [Acinetobacter johnsonii]MDH1278688.1 YeeE/YedE family protein [Acinetobacter johnsonii]MDH1714012.1 YeeE/YedE family protein [Acinetobacter johnsonii]MDQ8973396.1 YeeE/YedE family protein [Acinetobacter johnsonii]